MDPERRPFHFFGVWGCLEVWGCFGMQGLGVYGRRCFTPSPQTDVLNRALHFRLLGVSVRKTQTLSSEHSLALKGA